MFYICKKFFKIFLINTLFLIFFLLILDYFIYTKDHTHSVINDKVEQADMIIVKGFWDRRTLEFNQIYAKYKNQFFRKPLISNNNKKPIVIFGCSFAYGYRLKENQRFAYLLNKYTKRSVYDFSMVGWAPQHMIYQLQKNTDLNNIKNPAVIIYVFSSWQIPRLSYYYPLGIEYPYLNYVLNDNSGKLSEQKPIMPLIYKFFCFRKLNNIIAWNKAYYGTEADNNDNFDKLKVYFLYAKDLSERIFPNSKFVILIYPSKNSAWFNKTNRWNELRNSDITVINLNYLTNKNLTDNIFKISKTDSHPNAKAWETITPALINSLNL